MTTFHKPAEKLDKEKNLQVSFKCSNMFLHIFVPETKAKKIQEPMKLHTYTANKICKRMLSKKLNKTSKSLLFNTARTLPKISRNCKQINLSPIKFHRKIWAQIVHTGPYLTLTNPNHTHSGIVIVSPL